MKIACFGVRPVEVFFFEKLNTFGYTLHLHQELLTDDNVHLCQNADAVILRANCKAHRKNLIQMKDMGVKYVLTRTVGYDHIDLEAVKELGFDLCARVPGYSPNAISEFAVSLAIGLCRKTFAMVSASHNKDYTVSDSYFAKEIRLSTVGIFGVGRIGLASAKTFHGLGARVLGIDVFQSSEAKTVVEFTDLDTFLKNSDIILLHCQYSKEQNYHIIDRAVISKMKDGAILVNTARGELIDNKALLEAIESGKLGAVALDVLENESSYFFKDFKGKTLPDPVVEKLASYYPRVIITPHLGSFTDEALTNMIESTYQNIDEFQKKGTCKNALC